jgi:molybdopterin molybdotransferase
MRPVTSLIAFDRALEIVLGDAVPLDRTETIPVDQADERVAARDLLADIDVPPFHRSVMDGYAVVALDTLGASPAAPRELVCTGEIAMGAAATLRVGRGQCAVISTGAPLPSGADAVVMVEDTTRDAATIRVTKPVVPGQHVGLRGFDLAAGNPIVKAGDILSPARLGAIATTGRTTVEVYARPEVALISTGDELVAPGQPLGPGRIFEINRLTLAAIVGRHGGAARALPIVGDTLAAIEAALDAAATSDVIVLSGGSSAGDRDVVRDALAREGRLRFHGIAVKPGKPTAFGQARGRPVFGMPGNPTACLSNGYLLLVPFLRRLARLPAWEPKTVTRPLARRITSPEDRHQFYTVRLSGARVEPAFRGSGEITSLADADGYIEIPAGAGVVEAGTEVGVTLF